MRRERGPRDLARDIDLSIYPSGIGISTLLYTIGITNCTICTKIFLPEQLLDAIASHLARVQSTAKLF